ncbi:hypothetical protein H5410_019592 [Solanum commersonii]|uniref:Uncharacterized protein n=1 Tax=Solanum commersonii TaxID=4109 RepID=A0A9J5Z8S6_SOLCO|nr:hypothetical protein H5410_019592 [Solanum commersonii]
MVDKSTEKKWEREKVMLIYTTTSKSRLTKVGVGEGTSLYGPYLYLLYLSGRYVVSNRPSAQEDDPKQSQKRKLCKYMK